MRLSNIATKGKQDNRTQMTKCLLRSSGHAAGCKSIIASYPLAIMPARLTGFQRGGKATHGTLCLVS